MSSSIIQHGRSQWDRTELHDHHVPEGWEDADRGICPRCGQVVTWDQESEEWRPDLTAVVLVLSASEYAHLRSDALYIEDLEPTLDLMAGLSQPFEEAEVG